jgi:hypothetical protein
MTDKWWIVGDSAAIRMIFRDQRALRISHIAKAHLCKVGRLVLVIDVLVDRARDLVVPNAAGGYSSCVRFWTPRCC